MIDRTSLLISNLIDAFRQLNQYLALGLVTSISALALDRAPSGQNDSVPPLQGFVPMTRNAATLVLLGISFVAGLMGSYAAESAAGIVNKLQGSQELLAAACTYSSVATAPIGIPILAATLPVIFVAFVFCRIWKDLRANSDARYGLLMMLALFIFVYEYLGWRLAFMPCRAS